MNPAGTVTFLFTDIEGSTRLAQSRPDAWPDAQQRHHAILNEAIESHRGRVFNIVGDAFCSAFDNGPDALRAAVAAQIALQGETWGDIPIRVRMGLHTGTAERQEDGDYRGYLALSRVARLMSAAHGGQVLLSRAAEGLVREDLPPGVGLRDMGERRLKDLAQPEHIYQVIIPGLPADFPPLKTQDAYRHNLPPQLTHFIGRESDIIAISATIRDHHLVTLTGSGGTGKTRLALQVAESVRRRYTDGVWLVELATLTDASLIPHIIRLALRAGEPVNKLPLDHLITYLRDKQLLMLLDNCEHLIDAAAAVVSRLMATAPGLTILATSREALGVPGELAWTVSSLTTPDIGRLPPIDELAGFEAVQLFVDRVRLASPAFTLNADNAAAVAQICTRLDGIPMAIELAAARVKALGVSQIAARLDDRFRLLAGGSRSALPRQQTLRALVDWSCNLLAEPERILLRRLAVFSGGWTLEAAETVGGDDEAELDVLDSLVHLVDKSLVIAEETSAGQRYRFLETTRQYAREMLMAAAETSACRTRHLAYFLSLATQAELRGSRQAEWLDRLGRDHDNLAAALAWALETDPATGLELAVALCDYWDTRGHFSEGRRALEALLEATPTQPAPARLRGLLGAMGFAARQTDLKRWKELLDESWMMAEVLEDQPGRALVRSARGLLTAYLDDDFALAERFFEEALAWRRATGDKFEIARALGMPGMCALHHFDFDRAERLYGESLSLFREVGDEREIAGALWNLAEVALAQRNYGLARIRAEESLASYGKLEDRHGIATSLRALSWTYLNLADPDQARIAAEQSVGIFRELEDNACLATTLLTLAWSVQAQGDASLAETLAVEGLAIARKVGDKATQSTALDVLGRALLVQGRSMAAQDHFTRGLELQRSSNDNQHVPSLLEGQAGTMIDWPEEAARLLGAANALRARIGLSRSSVEEPLYDQTLAYLRHSLGETAFVIKWDQGFSGESD